MKISFICRGTTNNFHMTSHLASLWNRGLDNSQTAYSPIYAQRSEDWVGFVSKCIMGLIERRYHFFGSVHTYLEIFENTDFLLRFWKNTRPHGAYSNRLRSSTRKRSRNGNRARRQRHIRKSVLVPSHGNDKPTFSKNSILGTVFENLRFWYSKTPFTRGQNA